MLKEMIFFKKRKDLNLKLIKKNRLYITLQIMLILVIKIIFRSQFFGLINRFFINQKINKHI